jgi:hypothetical protein
MARLAKVSRRDSNKLAKVRIAGRIDCDLAQEVKFPDEEPCRFQVLEGSIAGHPAPGPNDAESSPPYPIAAHVNDEFFFAARDDERAEDDTSVFETRSQVCFLEDVAQAASPVRLASLTLSGRPVTLSGESP